MKTTYLEPPVEMLYHSNFRGLVRLCLIDKGYLLALTVERQDESGRWQHVKTEITTHDFFVQEFESLVHLAGSGVLEEMDSLPFFVVEDGFPVARQRPAAEKPVEIRDTLLQLLEHHFVDEHRHYQSLPESQREGHVAESWLEVIRRLDLPPAAHSRVVRVPRWLTAVVTAIVVPAILLFPSWLSL